MATCSRATEPGNTGEPYKNAAKIKTPPEQEGLRGYLPNEAQCPPEGAWPEPSAKMDDSSRRLTGLEWVQSQTKKPQSTSQNARIRVVFSCAMV